MSKNTLTYAGAGQVLRGNRQMTPRDVYLMRAAELISKIDGELDPALRAEFENLARAYLRLADQAELNNQTDIVYETPNKDRDQP
jgi:hypothetical protein